MVHYEEKERFLARQVEKRQSELFDLLSDLIRFPTPNPPGSNEVQAQLWVKNKLENIGLKTDMWEALPNRPNVVGVLKGEGRGPTVILNSHIDVCEDTLMDAWANNPYNPKIIDGRMIGRGSSDMKSALASFLFALQLLQENGVRLQGNVEVHSVMGEEAGEPGTQSVIKRGYTGDFAIVGESSKGDSLVPSLGLLTLRITIESKETLHLVTRKKTLNAGGKLSGGNCVEKMALYIIPALTQLEREWSVFKTHPLIPPGSSNINVFKIEGGANAFILPEKSVAHVTITYLPHEKKEKVMQEVEDYLRQACFMDEWLRNNPPTFEWNPEIDSLQFAPCDIDGSSSVIQILLDSIRDSGRDPILGGRGAITDAGWYYQAGIPTVVYGPGDVAEVHSVDESVALEDVVLHCKAIIRFLLRYCKATDLQEI